jgi:hypothetical protein
MGVHWFKPADHPIGWLIFLLDRSIGWQLPVWHCAISTLGGQNPPFRVTK